MSVAKNIEITSTSTESFDDAVRSGIAKASETVKNIKGAWIKEQKVRVNEGQVAEYTVMNDFDLCARLKISSRNVLVAGVYGIRLFFRGVITFAGSDSK